MASENETEKRAASQESERSPETEAQREQPSEHKETPKETKARLKTVVEKGQQNVQQAEESLDQAAEAFDLKDVESPGINADKEFIGKIEQRLEQGPPKSGENPESGQEIEKGEIIEGEKLQEHLTVMDKQIPGLETALDDPDFQEKNRGEFEEQSEALRFGRQQIENGAALRRMA